MRSGGAEGADLAFEQGADRVNGQKEIYLPWKGFNNSSSDLVVTNQKAFDIAEKYHPYWKNLKDAAKKLQARNSCQVLGKDLCTFSDFVICYTKNGQGKGGTGQAIRIAKRMGIDVFDAGAYENLDVFYKDVISFVDDLYDKKNNKLRWVMYLALNNAKNLLYVDEKPLDGVPADEPKIREVSDYLYEMESDLNWHYQTRPTQPGMYQVVVERQKINKEISEYIVISCAPIVLI